MSLKIKAFKTPSDFHLWLKKNQSKVEEGIWLKFFKKSSGIKSVTWDETVEVALCYGWIDSQKKSLDEKSYLQKYTPRRRQSVWSKRNTETAERLISVGEMQVSGLKEVEEAKNDGRWSKAYDTSKKMILPKKYLDLLKKNKKVFSKYEALTKSEKNTFVFSIHAAKKDETKIRRLQKFMDKLR